MDLFIELWNDPAMQAALQYENLLQLEGCIQYYMKDLDRITDYDYVPTDDDIVHCRKRTVGVEKLNFVYEGAQFLVVDVGGQRNERRKWINHFDNVDALLFVASLSEYDQVLREDQSTKRLDESLNLFREMCKNPDFAEHDMILLLNKKDLFMEKITRKNDLAKFYPEYKCPEGKDIVNSGRDFIFDLYKKIFDEVKHHIIRSDGSEANLVSFTTCATSTSSIRQTFEACNVLIRKRNLSSSGL